MSVAKWLNTVASKKAYSQTGVVEIKLKSNKYKTYAFTKLSSNTSSKGIIAN